MENSDEKDKTIRIYTNQWITILKKEIVYCATNSDNTLYYMVDGQPYNATGNLKETERTLNCKKFCRICNHHLVNLEHFDEFSFKTHIILLYYYRDAQLKVSPLFLDDLLEKLKNKPRNLDSDKSDNQSL